MTNLDKAPLFCDTARAETLARQQASSDKERPMREVQPIQDIPAMLDGIESMMLDMPQIDCPVVHHFGAGIYIREGFIAAGTYIIGHAHKKQTMNVLLKGKMAVFVNGQAKVIDGPYIFISEPGRKFGYAIEDCIFQNIHATDKTDLTEIEDEFIDKSEAWNDKQIANSSVEAIDAAIRKYLERSN